MGVHFGVLAGVVLAGATVVGGMIAVRLPTPEFTDDGRPYAPTASPSASGKPSTAGPQPATETGREGATASRCLPAQLKITGGGSYGSATGQHSLQLQFTNHGKAACSVQGRPTLQFLDAAGHRISGLREDDTHGRYPVPASAAPIDLLPGESATVYVTKYRCDEGETAQASTVAVRTPGGGSATRVHLTAPGDFAACRGSAAATKAGNAYAVGTFQPSTN